MNNKTNEEKPRKEITLRQAVQVMRKELVANRAETTAMRAEVAVMRTEIAAIHKVLEESKLVWVSIAESQRIIAQEFNKAVFMLDTAAKNLATFLHELDALTEIPDPLKNQPRRVGAYPENRCTYIHINEKDSSGTGRCCLIANHKGDHLYKCASKTCPGYPWVPTVGNRHPINTCGQVLDELRKAQVDDCEETR